MTHPQSNFSENNVTTVEYQNAVIIISNATQNGISVNKSKRSNMAHLQPINFHVIRDYSITCTSNTRKIPFGLNCQISRLKRKRGFLHCCSSATPSSADQQVDLDTDKLDSIGTYENNKVHFGYLVKDVKWKVRRMVESEDETREVAAVQAEAFHEPVFLFDDMFLDFFKAEVLAGLLYRLRNSDPDRYACLVAERKSDDDDESDKELAGVVDVTVQREDSVLQHLPGADEYLYVSGIAVLNKFRRQKVGTSLLKACDILSSIWGFEYLVLRAYEDDQGARQLYSNAGYRVVSGDSPWTTSWIGRRRRILMVKRP